MILLRQVSRYVYDVFAGKGWPVEDAHPGATDAQWTRVRRQHWGLVHVAGLRLDRADSKLLLAAIERNPQGNVDPIPV